MIAEIIINSTVRDLNKVFDYNIPEELISKAKIGSRVLVQFGNIKTLEEGYIIGFKENSEYKLKSIKKIEDSYLNEKNVELAKWIAKRYFCNISDAMKLMVAPGTTSKKISNRIKEKCINFVELQIEPEKIIDAINSNKIRSEKQKRALSFLIKNGKMTVSELENFAEISKGIINTLQKNGYIKIFSEEVERNPFTNKKVGYTQKLKLTQEQKKAYDEISEAIDDGLNGEFLIFGVTGSGKTEIYLQLIEKVLNMREIKYYACTRDFFNTTNCK